MSQVKPVLITDVALRDGHQSLIATRLRTEDMLPVCAELDAIGFWSLFKNPLTTAWIFSGCLTP